MQRMLKPLFFCAALLPLVAAGDFNAAVSAYENQDFAKAYQEFRRLAELGDAPSQRNLAVMYANGSFVERNTVEAWAWAALAAEQDAESSAPIRDRLASKLTDTEKLTAEQRLQELQQQYGQAAIAEKLLPVPADQMADCTVEVSSDARPVKTFPPRYPVQAIRDGFEGYTCLSFYLNENGVPLRASVYDVKVSKDGKKNRNDESSTRYANWFSQEAKLALQKWVFSPPATQALREIPSRYCLDFLLHDSEKGQQQVKEDAEQRDAAADGDPVAQYRFARKLETRLTNPRFPEDKRQQVTTVMHALYKQSAFAGFADSQFKMATNLLTGNQCEKDIGKGIAWLTFAAQQGHSESQYLLASRLRHGEGVEPNPEKAVKWLQAAAESGHSRAQLEYALYLLQHHPGQAELARRYLPETPKPYDLIELEAAALSHALAGNFSKAVEYQTEVVAIARDIETAHTEREQVLARYQAGQLPLVASLN
ncbi:MAG: hypothetical protein ACOY3E_04440 [Pseudomonadota bacterium]